MALSKSNPNYCPIRGKWVASTPEEIVRIALIQQMIGPLGYPKGLLAVEKDLASLAPSIGDLNRRVDLVCFYPVKEGLKPLLLIECKAEKLNREAENQLFGYNAQVGAPFVCLACEGEIKLLWRERGEIASVPFLPPYADLIEKV